MNTMHRQVGILGAYIDYVTLDEAVQRTTEFVADGSPHQVVTVNVDFIRLAQQDREFMSIINRSDLAIADGMPLVWASGWLGDRLPERVTGVELVQKCCELAAQEGGTVNWYAFKVSDTTYGIFDTFEDEAGRQAHLNGEIPAALGQVADDLLAAPPDIRPVDVIAVK